MSQSDKLWERRKTFVLTKDKSLKASYDAPIVSLIECVNVLKNFVTLSSCSGRLSLIKETATNSKAGGNAVVKCWHEVVDESTVVGTIREALRETEGLEQLTFKFEPLILHIQCRDLDDARLLISRLQMSGIHQSGIKTFTAKKIVVCFTGTSNLEIPLAARTSSGRCEMLVNDDYLRFIVGLVNNTKFVKNQALINKIESMFRNWNKQPLGQSDVSVATVDQCEEADDSTESSNKEFGSVEPTSDLDVNS